MKRFLSTAALTGALLFASAGAQAGMIHFSGAVTGFADLGGNPVANPVSSFAVGDAFSGVLDVADEALAPGAAFGNADIRDYRFSVGDTALTNDRTSIAGTLGPNGLGLDDFLAFTGISALGPACSFCSAEITEDGFTIDHFTAGGRILGLRGTLLHDHGAWTARGLNVPYASGMMLPLMYDVPAYDLNIVVTVTNKTPVTPVRGAGQPQATRQPAADERANAPHGSAVGETAQRGHQGCSPVGAPIDVDRHDDTQWDQDPRMQVDAAHLQQVAQKGSLGGGDAAAQRLDQRGDRDEAEAGENHPRDARHRP